MLRWIGGLLLVAAWCGCASTWTIPPGNEKLTVLGAFTGSENRIMGDIMKYGFPDVARLRYYEGYVLSYDGRTRTPRWVCERLNAKRLERTANTTGLHFRVDRTLPPAIASQSLDYADSRYVRGRMAAASNHLNDRVALEQTYYLSNVAPQDPGFRQHFWIALEKRVRGWAREADDLYVVTGPLYLPRKGDDGRSFARYEFIGENGVAVPTHFFKVMLREKGYRKEIQAFLVPHDPSLDENTPLREFLVTVDALEHAAGLDFFPDLSEPTQSKLEAALPEAVWGEEPEPAAQG